MEEKKLKTSLRRTFAVMAILNLGLTVGCFEWTQDEQGNLRSLGLPGVPVWQSKATPVPMTPSDMGFAPEESAKMSGPVLVVPPDNSSRAWRYRYYQTGQNKCQADLQKMLDERAQLGTGGAEPYCTDHPTQPTAKAPGLGF
jgi:hypothetical protein